MCFFPPQVLLRDIFTEILYYLITEHNLKLQLSTQRLSKSMHHSDSVRLRGYKNFPNLSPKIS